MSEQLFKEKYTERQLINSPAVNDFQVEPSYPELTDREVMKTKAAEWYNQTDLLTSPEVDPDHYNKIKAMGPVPVDAYGFPVGRHGDRLPDQFRGMSQRERMETLTGMSGAELADRTRQHALDYDQKINKANLRDTVIKDMLGDRMVKDPLSGIWRGKTEAEVLFEMGKGKAPTEDYGITKAEQDVMNPVTWAGVQVMAGGIDAMMNFARLTEEASLTMLDGPYRAGRAAALADPKRETASLYGPIGKAITVESDGSVSGALIRGFSQFLLPYTGALKAMSGVSKGLSFTKAAGTGAVVDFSTVQASDGNLSDLLLSFGVEHEALRYMSANEAASQFDARIRTAVDGFFFGEMIGLAFKGGVWTIKKTTSKIKQKQSANMIMGAVRAARGLNRAQADHVESEAVETIANHLMEEADRQADLPLQAEAPAAPAAEGAESTAQPQVPEPTPYAPSQEVKTAYSQYALSRLLKEDLTPEQWMKDMKGKGHPQLLQQAYTWAKKYMKGDNEGPIYYHRAERSVIALPITKKGRTGEQWWQELKNLAAGKGGKMDPGDRVNFDDLKWLELEGLLKGNKEKLDKDSLINFIQANRVEFEDVSKGGEGKGGDIDEEDFEDARREMEYEGLPQRGEMVAQEIHSNFLADEISYYIDEYTDEWTDELREEHVDDFTGTDSEGELIPDDINEEALADKITQEIEARAEWYATDNYNENPVYTIDYSTPNDEYTYKAIGNDDMGWSVEDPTGKSLDINESNLNELDIQIRAHALDYERYDEVTDEMVEANVGTVGDTRHGEYVEEGEAESYDEFLITLPKLKVGTVEEAHFREENIVVHVRSNIRTDVDGKQVLFIEEIQSDLAKQGERLGYKSEATNKNIAGYEEKSVALQEEAFGHQEEARKIREQINNGGNIEKLTPIMKKHVELHDEALHKRDLLNVKISRLEEQAPNLLPPSPAEGTSQWLGLSMRRMIRYAADKGLDRIAWTTGNMQAERWGGYAQQAETIHWDPDTGTLSIIVSGSEKVVATGIKPTQVSDYIGSTPAGRLIGDAKRRGGKGSIKGKDIIVEKGYRDVYDRQLPKATEKFIKQWDGKVKTTQIDLGREAPDTVQMIEITDDMKKSAKGGVPILQLAPGVTAPAIGEKILETEDDEI